MDRAKRIEREFSDRPKLAAYLLAHPTARRRAPVALVVSTSCRRVYECICGARESCSARWPVTKRAKEFIARHNAECGR